MRKNSVRFGAAVLCLVMLLALTACQGKSDARQGAEPAAVSAPAGQVSTQPDQTGKKVYFAGPLFCQSEKDFNLTLTKVLEEAGYQVFLPQRDGIEAALLEGKTEEELTKMVFEKDYSEIMNADILFMILDGRVPDEGACVELGIAYASGKRCYGVKTDTRSVESNLDVNPMLTGCFTKLFKDYDGESLIKTLRQYLAENEL